MDAPMVEDIRRHASGVVTDDPFGKPTAGMSIRFRHAPFAWNVPAGLNSINNWEYFEGAVIAIHFGTKEENRVIGSGTIVAPGVALVARHVVESEMPVIMTGEKALLCSGISPEGLVLWRVHQVKLLNKSDLAILTLQLASVSPSEFRHAMISTHTPRHGDRILLVGICHDEKKGTASNAIHAQVMVGHGTVTQIFETGRDRLILPGPAIEVDCPALGGMSGGPAFDEYGFQIGILTSSLEGEKDGPAFVSLLWPALGHRITPSWPVNYFKEPISLLEMDRRICGIECPEAISVEYDAVTGNPNYAYKVWNRDDLANPSQNVA